MSWIKNIFFSRKFKGIPKQEVETMKVILKWMGDQDLIIIDYKISLGPAGIALASKRSHQEAPDMNQLVSLSSSKAKTLAIMAVAQVGDSLGNISVDKVAQMIYTVIIKLIRCHYGGVTFKERDLFPLLSPPSINCCCAKSFDSNQ